MTAESRPPKRKAGGSNPPRNVTGKRNFPEDIYMFSGKFRFLYDPKMLLYKFFPGFLFPFLINHPFNQINGLPDAVIGAVDAQIIVFRSAPASACIKIIVFFMLPVHLL